MPRAHTFKVKKDAVSSPFDVTIPEWPETVEEAVAMWGEAHVMNCINGTSATVQAQGACRTLLKRKEDPFTQKKVIDTMAKGFIPSDGSTKRIDEKTKAGRRYDLLSHDEKVAFIMEKMGADEETAKKLAG
jgi:hypothetical protein